MTRLNKTSDRRDLSFLSESPCEQSDALNNSRNLNEFITLKDQIHNRRSSVLKIITSISQSASLEVELVNSLNFEITEYVFWSHFIFCQSFEHHSQSLEHSLSDHSIAISYLTSAIQFVPESKDALSHLVNCFSDRFTLEDSLLKSFSE